MNKNHVCKTGIRPSTHTKARHTTRSSSGLIMDTPPETTNTQRHTNPQPADAQKHIRSLNNLQELNPLLSHNPPHHPRGIWGHLRGCMGWGWLRGHTHKKRSRANVKAESQLQLLKGQTSSTHPPEQHGGAVKGFMTPKTPQHPTNSAFRGLVKSHNTHTQT